MGKGGRVAPAFENLTLWQRVYDHLRDEIMGDRLPPGTELSEVALSKELDVSRGPIREAMGRLAAEGLVTVRPRRGAEVRSISPEELIDSYQVREALEVLAVRLAVPRITDAEVAELDGLVDRMSEYAKNGDVADFFTANVAFHELICELSGNAKLVQVHRRLAGEIGRFQARTLALRGSLDGSVTEHRAILTAIRQRDVEKAAKLTAAHIRVPAQQLEKSVIDGSPPSAQLASDGSEGSELARTLPPRAPAR